MRAARPKAPRRDRHARVAPDKPFELAFFVPTEPRTKQRARTHMPKGEVERVFAAAGGDVAVFGAMMKGVKHRSFTPAETVKFERLVAQFAAGAMRSRPPCVAPIEMVMTFVFSGDPGTWPTASSDPDIDNVEKAVMDALKGIVWLDDRLVVRKTSEKACGLDPGVDVKIRTANP
jgi:Holliday junction resolvase RusA-like endonuclease